MDKYMKYPQVANQSLIDIFKKINTKEEFYVLELGCNTAINLKTIQDLYPKAYYFGVDISLDAIKEARKLLPKASFWCADIETKPNLFERELFDFILLPDILEHLTKPDETLEYIKHILKPDGYIITSIPNLMHWSIIANLLINGNFTYTDTGLLDYTHKHLFTYNEIIKLFNNCKYQIKDIYYVNPFEIQEEYKDFINNLITLSNNKISLFQYEAFTYYITAQKLD